MDRRIDLAKAAAVGLLVLVLALATVSLIRGVLAVDANTERQIRRLTEQLADERASARTEPFCVKEGHGHGQGQAN